MLRNQKLHRTGESGESVYSVITKQLGRNWAALEAAKPTQQTRSLIERLAKWRSKGSELAIQTSAERYYVRSFGERSESGGKLFDAELLQQAQRELGELEHSESPCLATLELSIKCGLGSGLSLRELKPLLKRAFELWPVGTIHEEICVNLLTRNNAKPSEAGAYLAAVTSLLPKLHSDLLYVRTTTGIVQSNGLILIGPKYGSLSMSRLLRSAEELVDLNVLGVNEVELLIQIAIESNKLELAEKLASYHYLHYGLVSTNVAPKARPFLRKIKTKMIGR